jgi:hypothetical protein
MPELPTGIDTSRPHPARTYDYFLGGKNNFAADREVADRVLAGWPTIRIGVRENRKFLARVVRYLAGEVGIRQFLDIGTGLPTADNVHEAAQAVAPSARVVYVDNDPLVLAHARALLTSSPQGRTAYIHADLRDPVAILNDPVTREVLDFTQPIALMLIAILHMIPDEEKPAEILATLLDALPSGSYIVASHITGEHNAGAAAGERTFQQGGMTAQWRDSDVFARLAFNGLDLVPPGVVLTSEWRNDESGPRPTPADVSAYGGVARKP